MHGNTCYKERMETPALQTPSPVAGPDFDIAFGAFMVLLQAKMLKHHEAAGFKTPCETFQHTTGPKYIRVTRHHSTDHGSAYCFVNRENGDILKPAGFKTPAKHARGNIFDADPVKGCGPYGVAYLR